MSTDQVYRIVRSSRRSIQLQITTDGTLLIRAPYRTPKEQIDRVVDSHSDWIARARERMAQRQARVEAQAQTPEQIAQLKRAAREILPGKVAYYSERMHLYPTGIRITSAEKRFGSCSGKNSLCFSYRLMMFPEAAIDYVVVHELAHIRHHDHSKAFYALVAQYLPDYKERERILRG